MDQKNKPMETTREKTTDYALVEEFMQYLLTLNSSQLTTFYCEICHERLAIHQESRPTTPFQENFGICSNCRRYNDVSNPHINRFLNERNLPLSESPLVRYISQGFGDETDELIRNWLIPNDYTSMRNADELHKEEASFTWVWYGRKQEKRLYKSTAISPESKVILMPFYPSLLFANSLHT